MNGENIPKNTAERSVTNNEKHRLAIADYFEEELLTYAQHMRQLLEIRHDLFSVQDTEYVTGLSINAQLYDDPAYNVSFIDHDLGLRNGNALEYHQTTEKYDRGFSEEHAERDATYRKAILEAAQTLGFVAQHSGTPSTSVDQEIGILDSELEPIDETVAAIVINGAAGMSNVKRVRDAVRNIESGAIKTETIIITAGTRPVNDKEKGRMKSFYRAGDTEYESMKYAVEDVLGVHFDGTTDTVSVEYGTHLSQKVETVTAAIGDHEVTIKVAESPFDNTRLMDDGSAAKRINTREAFLAAIPLMQNIEGAVVMQSHDAWTPWQNLIGQKVFGLLDGRTVYPAGPLNAERVFEAEDGTIDITAPQDVLDEIVKTYRQLAQMVIELRK